MIDFATLNYHHLLYFWLVVKEGGLVPAARRVRVSHPALSTQIRRLEDHLGERLLEKAGRRLVPTEMGAVVWRYADEIFTLGRHLVEVVEGRTTPNQPRLNIGVVDALPKLMVARLLRSCLALTPPVRVACIENSYPELLARLADHSLDLVIADAPLPAGGPVRAHAHLLGECALGVFALPALATKLRRTFPESLQGAPVIMPTEASPLRRELDAWMRKLALAPTVVAEIEDGALIKHLAAAGHGAFFAPLAIERDIRDIYGLARAGVVPEVRERYFAIAVERRIRHPAAKALIDGAHAGIFAASREASRARA